MSALPRPDVTGPAKVLNDALHDLHHRAGWPSLRTLAAETGVSHTTVSKTFSRPTLPTWGTLELLVEAMAGDTTHFHDLWLAASTPTDDTRPTRRIAGRRAELDVVRRHLETGTGLLLVTGEAGIGKTTLVAAGRRRRCARRRRRCLPLSTEVPLMPAFDALRACCGADGGQRFEEALLHARRSSPARADAAPSRARRGGGGDAHRRVQPAAPLHLVVSNPAGPCHDSHVTLVCRGPALGGHRHPRPSRARLHRGELCQDSRSSGPGVRATPTSRTPNSGGATRAPEGPARRRSRCGSAR